MTTKKEKELLRRSIKGNWRSREWTYRPADSAANFHARQQERRKTIPIVAVTHVQSNQR